MKECPECYGSGMVWDYATVEHEICEGLYEYTQEEYRRHCHNCIGEGVIFKEEND